ncbi:MAG: hypothetical protein RMK35_03385 [Aquificaceae bacterium]|nr:hypothetical protein [Aquificaceae bacterium]
MNLVKFLLILSLLMLFLLFIAQNAGYVDVSFFYVTYRIPLFALLLLVFTLGFLVPSSYFLLKEAILKKRVRLLEGGLKEWARGYLGKAEKLLSSFGRSEGVSFLLDKVLEERGKLEGASSVDETSLKEGRGEVEEKLKEAEGKDPENLRVLKSLRDFYALKGEWEKALEYQEKVLNLCEKWDKEHQKRIKAEVMAELYRKTGEDKYIESSVNLYTTPFVHAMYLKHLLSQDKEKDARKQWERVISSGYQEQVLWHLMEDQETLTKLLGFVEARAELLSPETLAMLYIKLNLLTKAKALEDRLSIVTKAFLYSTLSHREQDRLYLNALKELFHPFACVCGKTYIEYTPVCGGCLRWGEVKHVGNQSTVG